MHLEASLKNIREVIFIFRISFSFCRRLQCKPLNLQLNSRQGVIGANEAVTRKKSRTRDYRDRRQYNVMD